MKIKNNRLSRWLANKITAGMLDCDNYWDSEIAADIKNFVLLSKAKYMAFLAKYGFYSQAVQLSLFDELQGKNGTK
ncbi:hypothetical protein DRH29_04210 [candidate division Kazan bacterium]|uniref:Uncharacterized protein n=1 Tax=candidate division Kazan bacterium TaxID=2202143 RepID=A0A420ZBL5_UNCK3|nr:MAG: hypothetical protein DRH29_04210 [candidate division Kazan bacterium]